MAFSILYIYWSQANAQIGETRSVNDLIEKAYITSEVWFREGTPEYWNVSDVIDLGLSNDHRFNQTKMNFLSSMSYNRSKILLGISMYEFLFNVTNTTKYPIYSYGSYPSNAENVVKVKRAGLLDNGTIVFVEITVWE
jgi:hypothetical protein